MFPHFVLDLTGIIAMLGMFGTCLALAAKVLRKIERDETVKSNFPPHLHMHGRILYSKQYPPPETEPLEHSWGQS